MEISHEEFITILKEKGKYQKMKDNLRTENEKYEIMRWVVWNQRLNWKIIEYSMPLKQIIFFLCMYKMVQISKEGYKNVMLKLLTKEDTFG